MKTQIKSIKISQHAHRMVRTVTQSALLLLGILAIATGCRTSESASLESLLSKPPREASKPDIIVLREGDSVRISFPGAPNLSTVQQIRRDGRITLPLIGDFQAAGLTPPDMQKELLKLYGPQLQTKEVNVTVESSAFPIYVTGAVLRPGRINADHPLTALEAVMEAGVDYHKANLKSVRVIRNDNGQTEHYTLNLKKVFKGGNGDQFKLRPQDILYVPEKFSWF